MQKKRFILLPKEEIRKFVLMHFLTLSLLLILLPGMAVTHAQNKINLEIGRSTLQNVFTVIQQQTDYRFLYSTEDVSSVNVEGISVKETDVEKVLSILLKNSGLVYQISDNLIFIKQMKQSSQQMKGIKISGKVTDPKGEVLPGVTVLLKGTTVGCATDAEGKFSFVLTDLKDVILLFRYIGMEAKEIRLKDIADTEILKGNKELSVVLSVQTESLEDVVVTGYANVRKESYTGNSVRIDGKDIMKVANRNIISALQVFDPSFRMMENNLMGSDPNTMPEFYIRGQSGVGVRELDVADVSEAKLRNNPNLPIFILDGFDVSVEKIYDMDPNRIHSVTILKDAAATAIYGSRASNGVVVIETKAPKAGKLNVNYNFVGSLTTPDLSSYNYFDAQEKLDAEILAGYYDLDPTESNYRKVYAEYIKKTNALNRGVNTYWLSQPLKTGFNHKHSLYLDGGSESMRYGIELRYDNEKGVMKKSYRNRVGFGLSMEYRIKGLQIKDHVTFDKIAANNSPFGSYSDFVKQLPYAEMKDENGHYYYQFPTWHSGSQYVNPMFEGMETNNFDKNGYEEYRNNLSLNYVINSSFHVKGELSLTKNLSNSKQFVDPKSGKFAQSNKDAIKGLLNTSETNMFQWTSNILLMYTESIGENHINATLGLNTTEKQYTTTNALYKGFPSGTLNSVMFAQQQEGKTGEEDNHTRLFGSFLTLNYSYKDIYLLDGSYRMDGSSEFGSDKKWAPFWAAGVGLNIHKYDFWNKNSIITQLKLRGSFGQTGKVNFAPYAAKDIYKIFSDQWYVTGMGVKLMAMGNESLTWEKKNSYDVGVELTLKQGLFSFKGSYYNERTNDMLTAIDIPSSFGFLYYYDNLGEIRNQGFELQVRSNIINKKDMLLTLFANMSHNKDKILKISNSLSNYNNKVNDYYDDYVGFESKEKFTKPFLKYEEGGSMTAIYGMKSLGIDPACGKEIYQRRDGSITYDWEANEQQIIGYTEPDVKGSFGVNFSWKALSVYATFLYEAGGQRYNNTLSSRVENVDLYNYNADKRVLSDRWMKLGDVTPLKDIADRRKSTRPTSRFVQDYNVLDFNSLSVAWTFDSGWVKKLKLSMLKLQFNTSNLAHFSTVKQERGTSYPFARTFDFSLNVSF